MNAEAVEAYFANLPDDQRAALENLRQAIRRVIPDATEEMSYGVPAFKVNKKGVVSVGAGKNHCSFYVQSPEVMSAHVADLEGFDTSKGTVRFTPDKPLPEALVEKLVRARIVENEGGSKQR